MSTRIDSYGRTVPYDGAERAEEMKSYVAGNQTQRVSKAQNEVFQATTNSADQTVVGNGIESGAAAVFKQMDRGAKLEFENEIKFGFDLYGTVKSGFEVERLEDGRYQLTRSIGGGLEISEGAGVVEGGLKFGGDGTQVWRFETAEGAADAMSALVQQELVDRGSDESHFDRNLPGRIRTLDGTVVAQSAAVEGEFFAKAGVAAGSVGFEAKGKSTAECRVTVDTENRTVTVEEFGEASARLKAKAGIDVGVVEGSLSTDAAAVTVAEKIVTTYEMTGAQVEKWNRSHDASVLDDVVANSKPKRVLEQRFKASMEGRSVTAERKVPFTDVASLMKAREIDDAVVSVRSGVTNATQNTGIDMKFVSIEAKGTFQTPGIEIAKAKVSDLGKVLSSVLMPEETVSAHRARANFRD